MIKFHCSFFKLNLNNYLRILFALLNIIKVRLLQIVNRSFHETECWVLLCLELKLMLVSNLKIYSKIVF